MAAVRMAVRSCRWCAWRQVAGLRMMCCWVQFTHSLPVVAAAGPHPNCYHTSSNRTPRATRTPCATTLFFLLFFLHLPPHAQAPRRPVKLSQRWPRCTPPCTSCWSCGRPSQPRRPRQARLRAGAAASPPQHLPRSRTPATLTKRWVFFMSLLLIQLVGPVFDESALAMGWVVNLSAWLDLPWQLETCVE